MRSLLCLGCRRTNQPSPKDPILTTTETPLEDKSDATKGRETSEQCTETHNEASTQVNEDDPYEEKTNASGADQTSDQWTRAYNEAIAQLDDETRALVSKGRDLQQLFDGLNETNDAHKSQSFFRRGLNRLQGPAQNLNLVLNIASPAAGVDPTSSAAVGVVQSVTTLALGVCGVEERLNTQIALMLEKIKVIDACDRVNTDGDSAVHLALVDVYKDLFIFYQTVVEILTREHVVLEWVSQQFNDRISLVVKDFLGHADDLQRQITNATWRITQSIESMVLDTKIQKLLGASNVGQTEKLHLSLTRKMTDDACSWVTDDKSFQQWRNTTPSQALALFGDMGCGKTVTMTFIINNVRWRLKEADDAVVCYHYCRDDGTGDSLYIYSTLIQQLMIQTPRFKIEFHEWFQKRQEEGTWMAHQDSRLLGQFFFDSVKSLKRPVYVFLDGLDECDESSCNEILNSFRHHSPTLPSLKLSVSARYQADIESLLEGSLKMHMPQDSKRDHAIVSHMVNGLAPLNREGMEDSKAFVIEKLTELANGSAIWVKMAVDLLAKRRTTAHAKLQDFLRDELPGSQLPDMYSKLFSQVTGGETDNERVLSDALEILAIAERPLSIMELGWAVALRDPKAAVTTVEGLNEYVETEQLKGLWSPFVSIINSKGEETQDEKHRSVHLVHQSLRELVCRSPPRSWVQKPPNSSLISPMSVAERRSELQGRLIRDCMRYLMMDDIENRELFSEEQDLAQVLDGMPGADVFEDDSVSIVESPMNESGALPEERPEMRFDPSESGFGGFYTYAACHWLHHLKKAEHGKGPELASVVILTTPGTKRSENWWEQFHRPDCTLEPLHFRTFNPLNPFTIVALYGQDTLLEKLMQENEPASDHVEEQIRDTVNAVLENGDVRRLPLLIRCKPGQKLELPMRLFTLMLLHWPRRSPSLSVESRKRFDPIFDHITGAFDDMVEQQWGNEMFCRASRAGCLPFLERIMAAAGRSPSFKREIFRTPHRDKGPSPLRWQSVSEAAWGATWVSKGPTMAFLLQQDGIQSHLEYRDATGHNALHIAARCPFGIDVDVFRLLIPAFAEGLDEQNKDGQTPLRLVVLTNYPGSVEVAKLLLEAGADVRCGFKGPTSSWEEPLRMATRYGDLAMCQALVQVGGADPKSVFRRDVDGWEFLDYLENDKMTTAMRDGLRDLCEA